MKKNYLLFFLLVIIASNCLSQEDPYLDSLYRESAAFLNQYDYKNSIENSILLIEEAKRRNNIYYRYHAHTVLGWCYGDLRDTIRSKRHYEEALNVATELNNDTLLLWAYNNLGIIFSEDRKTKNKGINYYKKVINLSRKLNIPEEELTPTINIAWTYIDNDQYNAAKPYLDRAGELLDEDISNQPEVTFLWARYYMGINNPEKAREFFEVGIEQVKEQSLILAAEIYKWYAKLLFQQEDYKQAYLALEEFERYNSQIYEKEKLKQIEIANVKFDVSEYQENLETAQNQQVLKDEIIERSREKMIIMVMSSIVLIIILLILIRITLSRRKLISQLSCKNAELSRAKEEAERLSVLKTKFFSTISHELRTPLYGVIGLTSILLEDKSLVRHEEDLKSLKFSADYLLALINDVLQMNKMESNLVKLENVRFKLKDLMNSIVKSFEFTRLQNKNTIHLNVDPAIPAYLVGDPVRLSQILMNLVGNAMKFTERGDIWLTTKLQEEKNGQVRIYFEVKDNGMGIPGSKQEIIFEEFSQLKSANYNYQGTGLGLPIVRRLLLLFKAEIELESEEGVGSTFSFEIEFKQAVKTGNPQEVEEHTISTEGSVVGKTILIVDDNRINQVVTKRILEKKGFSCDICDNGSDAVEKVRNSLYNLILMDVNMPGISGLEATRQIRKFNPLVPVVALTAVEIEEIREEILEAGMNDFIVKPYDTSVFYQVIYRNITTELVDL